MKRSIHMLIKLRPFNLRIFAFTLMVVSAMTIVIWTIFIPDVRKAKQCFKLNVSPNVAVGSIQFFDDVIKSNRKPTPGKSIFFHETSCSKNGIVQLNAR